MTKKTRSRKRAKPAQPAPARLTLTLENYAGIKKQTWVGVPRGLSIDWPVEILSLLGERTAHIVSPPHEVNIQVTLPYHGMSYRSDNS